MNTTTPRITAWINLVVAALAMVATLPGRTIGLGIITEPLLADLKLDKIPYGWINLWSTLIGAAFSLGAGPLIDRLGARIVLTINALLLGVSVVAMANVESHAALAITLTLTRGFGQSALSVVAIAIVGKWFVKNINLAMAVFSALVAMLFIAAIPSLQYAVAHSHWRLVWGRMGWSILLGLGLVALAFARTSNLPKTGGTSVAADSELLTGDLTFNRALTTPIFWAVALSCATFNLIFSGVTIFAEAILRERGIFDPGAFRSSLAILALGGIVANFLGGYLSSKMSVQKLLSLGMFIVTASLLILPLARGPGAVMLFASLMGLAGGVVTVVFFAAWPKLFGRTHLGKIQGVAQLLTVIFSAAGPLITAFGENRQGSFSATFLIMAPVMGLLALACWFVPAPGPAIYPQIVPDAV